jgi:hypothetical protein
MSIELFNSSDAGESAGGFGFIPEGLRKTVAVQGRPMPSEAPATDLLLLRDGLGDDDLEAHDGRSLAALLPPSPWRLDEALVGVVNALSAARGTDPALLEIEDLDAALADPAQRGTPLASWAGTLELGIRFALLLALNAAAAAAFPYADLDPRWRAGPHAVGVMRLAASPAASPAESAAASAEESSSAGRAGRCGRSLVGDLVAAKRRLLFTRTKVAFWREAVKATET